MSDTTDRDVRDVLMFEAGMRAARDEERALLHRAPLDEPVIPMVHAFIDSRDAVGQETYGKPLRTFDGRNTIRDAQEEAGDILNYLTKLRREWDVIADLLDRASAYVAMDYLDDDAVELSDELLETAAKMRGDIASVTATSLAYQPPADRLAAMDGAR